MRLCREHAHELEADLQEFYGVDYRDRWVAGPHRLTLRRLFVLVSQLPGRSRLAQLEQMFWSTEAQLIDDVRMALTGSKEHPPKPHPQRPTGKKRQMRHDPARMADARRRSRERERQIAEGEIT